MLPCIVQLQRYALFVSFEKHCKDDHLESPCRLIESPLQNTKSKAREHTDNSEIYINIVIV